MSNQSKILIVDDRQENLFTLKRTLSDTNAQVVQATNGNDALKETLYHDFALAILDVHMPGMDGYELAEILRGEEKTQHLPLIFLSAVFGDGEHVFQGYEAGAVDYIVKPYNPVVLLNKVNVFLDLHTQKQLLQEKNQELMQEVLQRQAAEQRVIEANKVLESRVRERTRKLEEANRELEAFAYSVSHDLKAPLRAVEGYGTVLLEDCAAQLGPQGESYVKKSVAAAQRMSRLVEDLLNFSRTTKVTVQKELVDLSQLAQKIAAELAELEPQRTVQVEVVPEMKALGDPTLMRQVLYNLMENGWKFTRKKKGAKLVVGKKDGTAGQAFYVQDNGVGVDTSKVNDIFAPFQRCHSQAEFPGTGVGLATVQRILKRHGGSVWLESKEGEGTVVFFQLDQAGEEDGEAAGRGEKG